jgi:hypothetical protein
VLVHLDSSSKTRRKTGEQPDVALGVENLGSPLDVDSLAIFHDNAFVEFAMRYPKPHPRVWYLMFVAACIELEPNAPAWSLDNISPAKSWNRP